MPSLYELRENAKALAAIREIAEEADNQSAKQAVDEAYALLEGDINEKLERCASVISGILAEILAIKTEEKRLAEKRKKLERDVERLMGKVHDVMRESGISKCQGKLHTVSLHKNPAKLVIDDPSKIPDAYLEPQPAKPNNKSIKDALKEGEKLDFARLEFGESVRIK